MANVATRKIKPSVAWDDKGTCPTADGREAQSSDNQTNRLLDLQRNELGTESVETDSGLTEESWLRQGPLSRGVTQKLCQWFSVTQDAVEANVTSTFSLDKRSTAPSSKKIHKRVKLRRKKSTCTVHSARMRRKLRSRLFLGTFRIFHCGLHRGFTLPSSRKYFFRSDLASVYKSKGSLSSNCDLRGAGDDHGFC